MIPEKFPYPLPELIDRLSIVMLKIAHFPEENPSLILERDTYENAIIQFSVPAEALDVWLTQMEDINGQIWNLEANIRKGDLKEISLEEVGRTAIEIRKVNSKRVKLKGDIAEKTGSGFRDIKINHASE